MRDEKYELTVDWADLAFEENLVHESENEARTNLEPSEYCRR